MRPVAQPESAQRTALEHGREPVCRVCMNVNMHVCMHVCVRIYIYIYIYIYILKIRIHMCISLWKKRRNLRKLLESETTRVR